MREIEAAATDQTKAVIVTHTYGVPTSDMESIASLCLCRRWFLIEDQKCAGVLTTLSSGSMRMLGTFGDFACASMYANYKLLHGGDGGFVLAKDAMYGYRLGSLVNQCFTRSYTTSYTWRWRRTTRSVDWLMHWRVVTWTQLMR